MKARFHDWPELLAKFLGEFMDLPMSWGYNDCATWAAFWVEVCTGESVWESTYTSELGALQELIRLVGRPVESTYDVLLGSAVDTFLGAPYNYPQEAGRGDIALVNSQNMGHSLGIVEGVYVMCPGPKHILAVERKYIVRSWRVGAIGATEEAV